MSETITYSYQEISSLTSEAGQSKLSLSGYTEDTKGNSPCFFWGSINEPYVVARCFITLSNIVQSSFHLHPSQMIKDPIVTAGNSKIRFEGFSHCAGVYGRLDLLEGCLDGEFPENGTTNVDFNQPMINALSSIGKSDKVVLSVGQKEVNLHSENTGKVTEKKVPLPIKWVKGLTSVQVFQAESELKITLNRIQAIQLFKTIPRGKTKSDHYITKRGNSYFFTPAKTSDSICIGGVNRLKLLENLIPLINEMKVFAHPDMQSTTWQLYFDHVVFSFSLSRDAWRGFSGEGAVLESLLSDIPDSFLKRFDNYSYVNQAFNPTMLAIEEDIDPEILDSLSARLSAMGLLGYDLDENTYYYRRLPYKLDRIKSLNPRYKSALKLLEDGKVFISTKEEDRVEAKVEGTGVVHTVIITAEQSRCTCPWFAQYQGQRGNCKHILATKILLNE